MGRLQGLPPRRLGQHRCKQSNVYPHAECGRHHRQNSIDAGIVDGRGTENAQSAAEDVIPVRPDGLRFRFLHDGDKPPFMRFKMSSKVFVADIHWLRPTEGGRQTPVPMHQPTYAPLVTVDGRSSRMGSAWSFLCYAFEQKDDYQTSVYVRYLNPIDSPDDLKIGSKIELFEGAKKVAYGHITKEAEFDFDLCLQS